SADFLVWLRPPGVPEPRLADAVERDLRRSGEPGAEAALDALRRRGFGVEEVERLRAATEAVGDGAPASLLRALVAAVERLLGAPHRREAKVLGNAERLEAAAAVAVRRALDGLAELAALDPALAPDPAALERTLAAIEVRAPAPPAGTAVEVRHPLAIRARRVRALLVCGLQEGAFPRTPRPDPFLGDEERAAIARASGLLLDRPQESFERERYLFYACASRPEERLVLAWRTGDDEGSPVVPSLFVEDVRDLFDRKALEALTRRRGLGDLTWRHEEAPTPRERALAQAASGPVAAPRAVAPITAPEVLEELCDRRAWSAGQLEAYAGCPVKWLVEHYLRPEELEPESEPLLRGGIAHAVLEDALSGLRERTGSARVTAASLDLARDLLREALERREKEAPLSIRPARRRVLRRRLEADLVGYLGDLAGRGGPFEPRDLELSFGAEAGDGPGPLELAPDLALRGRIDRVDVRPGGREAVLVDYKGATAAPQAKWIPERRLQLGLYMLAAREVLGLDPVAGLYQPLGGERRARGVVLRGAGAEEGTTTTDVVDRERFEEVLDEVRAIALRAARELRSGRLEPRPDRCHWKGGGCAYPSICRCEDA
ncbi:MAG: PD-(D/E)XK nuclease family protein, partial [Solirubrobacteraceae bacterium]